MKHYLEAHFILSSPLPEESKDELKEFFDEFVKKTNEIREEGKFEIHEWNSKETKLLLKINSEDSLSPHVAILRLRKQITNQFGKKYRVGVRGFNFDKYLIETEIEDLPTKEFTIPLTKLRLLRTRWKEMGQDRDRS